MPDESHARIEPSERAERRARLAERLARRDVAAVVVGDGRDLRYLTGFDGVTGLGPSPFAGPLGSALILARDGGAMLLVPEPDHWHVAVDDAIAVTTYATFTDLTSLRPRERLADAIASALDALGVNPRGTVGYGASGLSAGVLRRWRELTPDRELVDVDDELAVVRIRKSAAELAAIRRSIALCDAAQRAVAEGAAAGMTRAAIQDMARAVVERATGPGAAIVLEASWGEDFGEASWRRPLRAGDLLLTDIAPRLDGYWGDSCNTRPVGPLGASQRAMLDTLRAALAAGTEAVRAGVAARAVDAVMRERVGRSYRVY